MSSNRNGKKIALFVNSLRGGGAERAMVHLATGFVDRGFDVDLILVDREGPYLSLVPAKAKVIDLQISKIKRCLPRLIAYLRREKPDALIASMGEASSFAIVARALSGVSFRLLIRMESVMSLERKYKTSLLKKIKYQAAAFTYNFADVIVAVSQGVASDMIHNFGINEDKVKVVYNPIVNQSLLLKAEEHVDMPCLPCSNIPMVVAVGRLTTVKDYPTLIRAFSNLRKMRPLRMSILGEGEERPHLEELIRELDLEKDIALPGFVVNPFAYMKKASLFVLSSMHEGFGNVLVEAMACGIPVVSTNCPSGPAEILENGRWGRLVPVGDVDALAVAMKESLDDTRHPDVYGRALTFSVDRAVEQHVELLFP